MNSFKLGLRLSFCLSLSMGALSARPHFALAADPAPASGVAGRVTLTSGAGVSGVTGVGGVTLQIGQAAAASVSAKTNADGRYSLTRLSAGSYIVRPERAGYKFSPESSAFTLPKSGQPASSLAEANFVATRLEVPLSGLIRTPQGAPLTGASVIVTGDKATQFTVLTNSQGIYEFARLPYGRYTVTPKKEGFLFDPKQRSLNLPGTVSPFAPGGRADFVAKSTAPLQARIFGRVTNNLRQGVAGVGIFFGNGLTPVATTGADGKFAVEKLVAGHYVVVPKKAGSTFAPASRSFDFSATTPTASLSREANFQVKEPVATYSIRGRVADENGAAIAGVAVEGEGGSPRATTNNEGRYEFRGLLAGLYNLKARKASLIFSPEAATVELPSAGPTSNGEANFTLQAPAPTFSLRGRVGLENGDALPGASILIGDDIKATSDAEGRYSISGLEAGSYLVSAVKTGFDFSPGLQIVSLPAAGDTETNFVGAEGVSLYYVFGVVKNSAGESVAGVAITLDDDPRVRAVSNAQGFYAIIGLRAGKYAVHPHLEGAQFFPASATISLPSTEGINPPNAQCNFLTNAGAIQ